MKIAILVDPHYPVPPEKYGGTERLAAYIINGLTNLGHEVTLFGPGDSTASCRLIACSPTHINIGIDKNLKGEFLLAKQRNIQNLIAHQDEFDVVNWHGHFDKAIRGIRKPILFTLGNPLPFSITKTEMQVLPQMKQLYLVAISKRYMGIHNEVIYFTQIYNGLPVEKFPFSSKSKCYMTFVGRLSKYKQPHVALQAAKRLNKKIIVGAALDRFGQRYFDRYCKPYLNSPLVDFRGEVNDEQKKEIFRFAEVNLHPVLFNEQFGFTVVEAGLCGTPTIAFDKGSMRELIVDGVSGYVVKNLKELIAVYPKALQIERKKVREHFQQFNQKAMAQKYVAAFEEVINKQKNR